MQTLALILVTLEVILCVLLYFCCVYIRRKQQNPQRQVNSEYSNNVGPNGPAYVAKNILVFVPYAAAKGSLGKTGVMRLACTNCVKVFNEDDETLRLIPTCGHVFHPTCLLDPCSSSCPVCQALPISDGNGVKPKGGSEEVLEIKAVKENMIRLPEEITKK
ncbi:E3 ubiquitin-protein ligase ATL6 [Bienertia sinuspersici]